MARVTRERVTSEQFVCAFRGARDRYQAPLALAEAGRLDQLITDAYATPAVRAAMPLMPERARQVIGGRYNPGIPDARVDCLWGTTLMEHARHRLGYSPRATWLELDRRYSQAAATRARETGASLFLYSPYAWDAFVATYRHTPRRVLFQYHPHPDLETRVLTEDAKRFPGYGESFADGRAPIDDSGVDRERNSWRHADLIICASAFTRRSLVEAGCDERLCHVIPYGIDLPSPVERRTGDEHFHALFVGSGGQRKGLHHLLLAWQRASLPASSRLTLICRVIDREIERLAATLKNVEVVRGASSAQLDAYYAQCTLFVMPSLVEGFGQVYLEAMAQGCPVLGTLNTALPDLGDEQDGIFLTPCGDVTALAERLEHLASVLPGNMALRSATQRAAGRFPWSRFRQGLGALLQ